MGCNVFREAWLAPSLRHEGTPPLEFFALKISRPHESVCSLAGLSSVLLFSIECGALVSADSGLGRGAKVGRGPCPRILGEPCLPWWGQELEVNKTPSHRSLSTSLSGRSSINASVWGKKQKHSSPSEMYMLFPIWHAELDRLGSLGKMQQMGWVWSSSPHRQWREEEETWHGSRPV